MKILTKEEEQAHYKYAALQSHLLRRSLLMMAVRRSKVVLSVVLLD